MGQGAPEDLLACTAHLIGSAQWETQTDLWKDGRFERMIALCLVELTKGYAADSAKFTEASRASFMGMSKQNWHQRWKSRYARLMRDALRQVSAAQEAIGRRVVG